MAREKTVLSSKKQFHKFQIQILLICVSILFIAVVFLLTVMLNKSEDAMRDNTADLITANSNQLEINIDSYLKKMETTAALLFANEDYYLYDASNERIDEYDRVVIEKAITDRIVDLGMMENFADFFIVYPNDHTVGWASKVTAGLFFDADMYSTFAEYASNPRTNDGWAWGINGNTDRIYYVKRLNENAILVTSIYNKELDKVFKHSDQLKELNIRLINDDNQIMFSSVDGETGELLSEDMINLIYEYKNATIIGSGYIANVNTCENGWRVVCSIPESVVLKSSAALKAYALSFALTMVVVLVLVYILMLRRVTINIGGMVDNLAERASFDQLSGVLNKASLKEQVTKKLSELDSRSSSLFIMLDMDNFKQINDQSGHMAGDKVIQRMGQVLTELYAGNATTGRLGGDEFAIYKEISEQDETGIKSRIEIEMETLMNAFKKEFASEVKTYQTSISVGVSVQADSTYNFETAYHQADVALYKSKKNGKDQFTVFKEGMKGEKDE